MGLVTRVMPPPSADDYEQMIVAALRHQLIARHHLVVRLRRRASSCSSVYRAVDAGGRLPARVNVMPLRRVDGVPAPVPLPEQHHSDYLQVDTVKFLADGGLSGATAALSVPYRHADTRGMLRFERDDLLALCRESHDAGWRIATHAIGDVAIDQVLDIYETLGPHPRGLVHRLEHFGLPDARQLARAARLGVIAVPQTIFIHSLGRNFREYLPDALPAALLSDPRDARRRRPGGAVVRRAGGRGRQPADRHAGGASPGATATAIRIAPEQAITVREALDGYTLGGALATGHEGALGAIAPGAWADFAVLSGDPLATPRRRARRPSPWTRRWLAGERRLRTHMT